MTRTDSPRPFAAADLSRCSGAELLAHALAEGVAAPPNLTRGELLAALWTHRLAQGRELATAGVLDVLPEGFAFVRSPAFDYEPSPHDPFVSPSQVRALNLKSGHPVDGPVRGPRGSERFFALVHIDHVHGDAPQALAANVAFAARTPVLATRPLPLAATPPWPALGALAPWWRGQRVLLTAPPAWPRARWLTGLATALHEANADLRTFACLLDQRPEDLAAAKAATAGAGRCEVVGTTFDQAPERALALAELVLARAQREVETGADVVLVVDSLTALVHAAQRTHAASGHWLCPGLDAVAVLPAKRLFAAARACAEGGSLTVVATAVAGGGDAFADAVLAEFRDRGNAELVVADDAAAAGAAFPFAARATRTRPEDDVRDATAKAAAGSLRAALAAAATPADRDRIAADWRG
jgi:transcription termination factor Rho